MIPVAVTQRVDLWPERGERRDALDQRLSTWLSLAGLLACPVPNNSDLLIPWLEQVSPAGVVLSGGNDLGTAPERDNTEEGLLTWAAKRELPVLGICRGMQMLAVRAGTILEQLSGHPVGHHEVVLTESWPTTVPFRVNSFHNWGFLCCPDQYYVLGRASDGSIEAIRHTSLPWEGWMWHPEREAPFRSEELERLKSIFGR